MSGIFSRFFGKNTQKAKTHKLVKAAPNSRSRFQPQFENLEQRAVLSCTVGTIDNGHTLVITGDAGHNDVKIIQDDATNHLTVICDGVTNVFTSSTITKLNVDLGQGDDDFSWTLAPGSGFIAGKQATINLGEGNDTADIEMWHGNGETWVQSSLKIDLYGGAGNDSLNANFGHKHGGKLELNARMGAGDDEAFARLWGDVSGGADVIFNLLGEAGNDHLNTWNTYDSSVSSYNSIDITHDSTVTLNLFGGTGNDQLDVTYGGEVDGKLKIRADGGAGNDTIHMEVLLKAESDGSLDAAGLGGDGSDKLQFKLTNQAGSDVEMIKALLNGGKGYDYYNFISTTNNVQKLNIEGVYPLIALS